MALHHAVSGEVIALPPVREAGVKSVALVKTGSFETIHLVVRAGEHIAEHRVGGSLSLYCLEGEAIIDIPEGERRMASGDWLYLDPEVPHAVRASQDTGLLLTVLFDRPPLDDDNSFRR